MSKIFKFKQFTVQQDQCAMKVGTDGVLLGAWTDISAQPNSILDIGSGTGLIALMLAQRSAAQIIDAIEIDDMAFEQCVSNFENSPWSDRLFCYHAGFDEFVDEIDDLYDLIISNPPFYSESVSSGNFERDQSRLNHFLPFEELLEGVSKLLSKEGIFGVIIPHKEEKNFIAFAEQNGLFPKRITRVKGNINSEIKRSLLELSFLQQEVVTNSLIIERERHKYTQKYTKLTSNFYLKM